MRSNVSKLRRTAGAVYHRHDTTAVNEDAPHQASADALHDRSRNYHAVVKTIASGRVSQVAAKYGEHAPMATVCCNACRTCVTTNVLAMLGAAATAASGTLIALVRRRRAAT